MPVVDGLELLRQQQALPATHRQVMTTVVVSFSTVDADKQGAHTPASCGPAQFWRVGRWPRYPRTEHPRYRTATPKLR